MEIEVILGIIILIAIVGFSIYKFIKLDRTKKIANIKEWLKWAVIRAEKHLGGGTGQLKLREVYDLAVAQFPWLVTLVTFEIFSEWVDEALDWMRDQLKNNTAIDEYVKGSQQ